MEFPFGLEKEAEIYCTSVLFSMKQEQEQVNAYTREMASDFVQMGVDRLSYDEVVTYICQQVKDIVIAAGWRIDDEDGAAWICGLLCKSYVKCLSHSICPFNKIFKDCFKQYFEYL